MSKTRQVTRTQMDATTRFTIRVFATFSDWQLRIERNETVARKNMRFKPGLSPESLQWGIYICVRGFDILKI